MTENRIINEAYYVVENNATVRETAKVFGVSKSTVHKDVSIRLRKINPHLYERVKKILDVNFSEKHLRGGMATKSRYERLKTQRRETPTETTE